MRDELSSEARYATVSSNTQNEPSKIIEWDVPDGVEITLREAQALVFDAQDTNGNDLPADTEFAVGVKTPDALIEVPTFVSEFDIRPFNALSLSQQQSGDNAQRRRLSFDDQKVSTGEITISDSDTIEVWALSGADIDAGTVRFSYPALIQDE